MRFSGSCGRISGSSPGAFQTVINPLYRIEEQLIDSFVLGNPHEGIFPAIYGTTHIEHISSLGILETFDAAAIIVSPGAFQTVINPLYRIDLQICGSG